MKTINELNWNKIGWRALQALLFIIINGATIAYFTMKCIDIGDAVEVLGKKVQLDYFYALPLKFKILVYIFMLIGAIATYCFAKLLYKSHREDKQLEKQSELEEKKMEKLADKLMKGGK